MGNLFCLFGASVYSNWLHVKNSTFTFSKTVPLTLFPFSVHLSVRLSMLSKKQKLGVDMWFFSALSIQRPGSFKLCYLFTTVRGVIIEKP
jgi:hypothetical protein